MAFQGLVVVAPSGLGQLVSVEVDPGGRIHILTAEVARGRRVGVGMGVSVVRVVVGAFQTGGFGFQAGFIVFMLMLVATRVAVFMVVVVGVAMGVVVTMVVGMTVGVAVVVVAVALGLLFPALAHQFRFARRISGKFLPDIRRKLSVDNGGEGAVVVGVAAADVSQGVRQLQVGDVK